MTKGIIRINQELLNYLILLLGIILLILGIFVPVGGKWMDVLLGIGCSLIASAVVLGLNNIYIQKREEEKIVIDKWGLCAVFSSRSEMNIACDYYLVSAVSQIDMIGFGFRSLRDKDRQDKIIQDKAKKGVAIRIISMDPNSPFLAQREKDENVTESSIKDSIIQLKQWVDELKSISPRPDKIEVRFYDSIPLDFYFRVDGHVFVGPYEYGRLSQHSISYEYRDKKSEGFVYYTTYFESLWKDADFCKTI